MSDLLFVYSLLAQFMQIKKYISDQNKHNHHFEMLIEHMMAAVKLNFWLKTTYCD